VDLPRSNVPFDHGICPDNQNPFRRDISLEPSIDPGSAFKHDGAFESRILAKQADVLAFIGLPYSLSFCPHKSLPVNRKVNGSIARWRLASSPLLGYVAWKHSRHFRSKDNGAQT
jgi:hypothetical protein